MGNEVVVESKREKKYKNKKAVVKDENGYYKIHLGVINSYNYSGVFYRHKEPLKLITEGSIIHRRINNGLLIAEEEHPDFEGYGGNELVKKILFLDIKRKCANIKAVSMVGRGMCEPGWDGWEIHDVYGWVKPAGPYGKYLEESLEDDDVNTAFSIRSVVRPRIIRGVNVRDLLAISTWDHTYEPGYLKATKWTAAGIENMGDACIGDECMNKLETVIAGSENMCDDQKCLIKAIEDYKLYEERLPRIFEL